MARFIKTREQSRGASPGALIFLGSQKMEQSQISLMSFSKDSLIEKELNSVDEVTNYLSDDHVTWLNIDGMHNIENIEKVGTLFNISPLLLEDILNTDQRPKFIEDDNFLFIILKSITYGNGKSQIIAEQISFIVGKNYLISFQERIGDHFDSVRDRIRNAKGRIRALSADYLFYALFDSLVDNYIVTTEAIGDDIEKLDKLLAHPTRELIAKIYHLKTEVTYLRKYIRPTKEVMTRLIKSDSVLIHKKTRMYIDDLDDLVIQSLDAIEIYYTLIADQLNIYHANVSNRVNDVMKVLTIFASIFIPLTFIVGVYGTNFDFVPEYHMKYGYYLMWGIMITLTLGMLAYFKKQKWL